MRYRIATFCFLTLCFIIWPARLTRAAGQEKAPLKIDAKSAILVEVSTGTVLFEQNADEPIQPASFTKVLTLYLLFEAIEKGHARLNDAVYISKKAWRTGGSKMFVEVGDKVPLEELIKGIAVVSGNDACTAVAEHIYGSTEEFVNAMNKKAQQLGMTNTHFKNPHGLPAEGQLTTARDMAKLDVAYLRRFPEALKYHSMREYSYNNINQYNRNRLLVKDSSVDGLKTGYVAAAGYHLSATAKRDGMRLLAVVMGAKKPSVREREALKLLNYGFRNYALVTPFPADEPVATARVWKGVKDEVALYAAEPASCLIKRNEKDALRWELELDEDISAPITSGQKLGKLVFLLAGEPKKSIPLVSREDIALASWPKRVWQTITHFRIPEINWIWLGGIGGAILLVGLIVLLVSSRRSSRRRTYFRK